MSRRDTLLANIALAEQLCQRGESPHTLATVCGTAAAQRYWQRALERMQPAFAAQHVVSLHEDRPVNQAFGLLLCWERLRRFADRDRGTLAAFVFGEGSRAAPWTEAECGQKPALATFVRAPDDVTRLRSMVELALHHFVPVQQFLVRSGFDGLVVKWGDEVQVPARDLSGRDPLFDGADVVRFVSLVEITEHLATQKDWVGVDEQGRVTAFLPRRALAEMELLADRALVQRRNGRLYGGVNLGSIALSRLLLDLLLEEFEAEVSDLGADRKQRPDLDPQFFTALTIAAIADEVQRSEAWQRAVAESTAVAALQSSSPDLLDRLRRVFDRFEQRHGRSVRMVALDCGEPYWGDAGQHRQLAEFFHAVADTGEPGVITRALAGIPERADENGNRLVGNCRLGAQVQVRDSVLIDAEVERGRIENGVLVGTRAQELNVRRSFDVGSCVRSLSLEDAGSYRVVARESLQAGPGERLTTVFDGARSALYRVCESTDLRDRAATYDAPILGNPRSFAELHAEVLAADPAAVEEQRQRAQNSVLPIR